MKNEIRVVTYDPKDFCRLPDNDVIWLRFNVPDGIVDLEARRKESASIPNLRRRVLQGHIIEWQFVLLRPASWVSFIEKAMPLFERIRAGYAVNDKGCAVYSVDAMKAAAGGSTRLPVGVYCSVERCPAEEYIGRVGMALVVADHFSGMSVEDIIAKYDTDPDVVVDGMEALVHDALLTTPIGHRHSSGVYCHFCAELVGLRDLEDVTSVFAADYGECECAECGGTLKDRMIQRADGIRQLLADGRTGAEILAMSQHDIVAAVVPEMRE